MLIRNLLHGMVSSKKTRVNVRFQNTRIEIKIALIGCREIHKDPFRQFSSTVALCSSILNNSTISYLLLVHFVVVVFNNLLLKFKGGSICNICYISNCGGISQSKDQTISKLTETLISKFFYTLLRCFKEIKMRRMLVALVHQNGLTCQALFF